MNTQDETEITKVKRQDSYTTLQSLKLMSSRIMSKLTDGNMAIHVMLKEESAEKFVLGLMKCRSLALHLLAHDWSMYHSNINTWFCPYLIKWSFGVVRMTYNF